MAHHVKYSLCLYLFHLLLVPVNLSAQYPNLRFKHISIEQGLSNSTIESIYQDKRGFIWIGTRDGLNRYDGNRVLVYRFDSKDSNSISDNYIQCIGEDNKQQLWIGTSNGLNRFNAVQNNFTRFKQSNSKPGSLSNNHISSITTDQKGKLWITTLGGGINLYDPSKQQFLVYRQNAAQSNGHAADQVNCLFQDLQGIFWVGTDSGLLQFDPDNGQFIKTPLMTLQNQDCTDYSIKKIIACGTGQLLLGTNENGLILYNQLQHKCSLLSHSETDPASLGDNLVRSLLIGHDGRIWVGCVNGGLNLFDPIKRHFTHYQNQPDQPSSLSQRTVSALFEDNQGNLWVGTHRGGINLYTPHTEKFGLFNQQTIPNGLSYNDVKAFCEDRDGNIWIGTDGGGLDLYNPTNNSFKHFRYNAFNNRSIGSNEVLDIMEDQEGNCWVSTWGGGLCLYHKKTGDFTRFVNRIGDKNSISSNYVQKVFEDRNHRLWVATYFGGLNLFDRRHKVFYPFTSGSNHTSIQGKNILSINQDRSGNLWFSTDDGGLNCLQYSNGSISHYFNDEARKPDLRVIFTDSKGRVWIGQSGLYLFDSTTKRFNLFTDKAGLATEFIKGITEDANGNFWISGSNGLTRFNPETQVFKKYNTADGLQGLEFEANAFLKTRAGILYFGGINGFNRFYPSEIIANSFIPPVYITDFKMNNQPSGIGIKGSPLTADISYTNHINLSYQQSTFSFGFAALNYSASENNQYAWKLENWDKDWVYAGKERQVAYTNVSPGHYTFRVKAANNDGVWNEKETTVTIDIKPPFQETWWFRLFLLSGIAGLTIWYFRFRSNLEKMQLEESRKEAIHQDQLRFFTNISHEFRTPLSLILGPIEKLEKENPHSASAYYYRIIHRNALRMVSLINELMDFRKAASGILKLNIMPGRADLFLQEITGEFEELATEKNITYTVETGIRDEEVWFDRQVLEKVIINLLSNAFKYTGNGGSIRVEAMDSLTGFTPAFQNHIRFEHSYQAKKHLLIRVIDSGIGIDKEAIRHLFESYFKVSENHLGSGIGLAFVKSLVTLHRGHIYVNSEKNKGTEIIVAIPCDRQDYSAAEMWVQNKELIPRIESLTATGIVYDSVVSNESLKVEKDGKYRILVVDDNEELRHFLRNSLHETYLISEATDGESGYATALEENPDLIISDVMMPGIDGIEFCRMIRENIETSHIPFLMLTAKDALASNIAGVESGADYYFAKPLSMDLLEHTIRNILLQKQKLKDKYLKDSFADLKDLAHTSKEKVFMEGLISLIESQLSNTEMNIDQLCMQVGMSRTKMYHTIRGITGQSISDFIRTIRLKKAAELLTRNDLPISEVMYQVGIQTQSYFTKAFKQEFGKTPTQFIKDLGK